MSNKIFIIILVITIVLQISFSFYYSSEIINQNNSLNKNLSQLDILEKQQQSLEKKLADLTSILNLQNQIKTKNLIPINKNFSLLNN